MIDHFTLSVLNLDAAKKFFAAAFKPLGFTAVRDFGTIVGYGDTRPYFWVKQSDLATTPQHIAFVAKNRAQVDAFHSAALAVGAKDDGAPGIRLDYHPSYYGAFVIAPEGGHFLEAVCHFPPFPPAEAKKTKPAVKTKAAPAKKAGAKKKAVPSKKKPAAKKKPSKR